MFAQPPVLAVKSSACGGELRKQCVRVKPNSRASPLVVSVEKQSTQIPGDKEWKTVKT